MRAFARTVWAVILLLLFATVGFAYEGGPVEGGATIQGTVRFNGPADKPSPHQVFKHQEVCGKAVEDESLVLGPQNSVRYAVVSIEGITRGKQLEHEALNVLDNQRCRFVPHVLAASVGQWLVIENSDPILHNADAVSLSDHKTLFNRGLPPNSQSRQPLIHADRLHVTCEVRHTWMEAYVVVADHPYVAVTDAEGAYELRDVPPGKYTLKVWHERLGSLEQVVTVEKGGRHVEDFTFSAPNK